MIEIKNFKRERMFNPWDVQIDRGSILGNPFIMRNETERNIVCDKYQDLFDKMMASNTDWHNEVLRLKELYDVYKKLNLFCWCAPKRCHAETIKKYIEQLSI